MPDWKGKNIQLIQEASRHAEAKLEAQVQLAVSADARASILSGVYAAAASGTVVVLVTNAELLKNAFFVIAATAAALSFLAGSILCISATWPCDFQLPGNEPRNWQEDFDKSTPLVEAMGEQLEHFDADIQKNNATLKSNARKFKAGVIVGMASPVIGAVVSGLYSFWPYAKAHFFG